MRKSLGEYKTALNLIKPSSLRATIILKVLRVYLLALALLVSGVYGFSPSIGTLAKPEHVSSLRIDVPEIPEVPGDPEDPEYSEDPDYPEYPDDSEGQEDLDHPVGTFSVRPELPESQIAENVGFFYLATNPGEEQFVLVRIENFTGEYQSIEVSLHLATTDNQGVVDYGESDQPPDTSLPHNIEDLVSFEPYIQLNPHATEDLWITIQMPMAAYQGVLAGGLTFTSVDDPFQSQRIAMLLRQGGFVSPELLLEDVTVEDVGGQNVIHALLRNTAATFIGEMNITTQIRDYTGEVVFTHTGHDMEMAPNSSFTYEVGLHGLQMSSEQYEVTFIIESGADSWERTWAGLQGTGTAAPEIIEEEVIPEPIPEIIEEEESPQPPAMLDEESLYSILLLLMVIAGIFVLAVIIVSIVRSKKEKANDFVELQEQILATLMNDEEDELKFVQEERSSPRKARSEQRNDQTLGEIEKGINEKESGRKDKASDEEDEISEVKEKAGYGKDKDIEKKKREIEKREREIARIKKELEDKEKTLKDKEKNIEEKEKTIEEKRRELERKETEKKERTSKKVRKIERRREEWEIDI